MLGNIRWGWVTVAFIAGGLFGQRFAHMHPVGAVKSANGG
jgi:hypothetical protein